MHRCIFLQVEKVEKSTATARVVLPPGSPFYVCIKRPVYEREYLRDEQVLFKHQGTAIYNTVSISLFFFHFLSSYFLLYLDNEIFLAVTL